MINSPLQLFVKVFLIFRLLEYAIEVGGIIQMRHTIRVVKNHPMLRIFHKIQYWLKHLINLANIRIDV
jgi:hypothetical protein